MKLKHSLYVMIFLCSFIPVLIWCVFSVNDTRKRLDKVITENIEAIAGSQIMSIENFCEGRKYSMETIARLDLVKEAILSYDTNGHSEVLDEFLDSNEEHKDYVVSISVIDVNFRIIGSSENYENNGMSDFQYSNEINKSGEFRLGDIYDRHTDNGEKRVIPAYIGIYDNNALIGYLIEEIDCTYFDKIRLNTDFLEEGTIYLLDSELNIITAGTGEEIESRREMVTSIEERESYQRAWDEFDHEKYSDGIIRYEYSEQEYMTYFSELEYTGWNIRITENMTAQLKSNYTIYLVIIIQGILVGGMIFIVQMVVSRRLVAPFNQIMGTFKQIQSNHDYSLRTGVKTKDEVGFISSGVDELLDYIEKEELLEKQKHREFAEEARKKAEASNLAKSTFLYNASHDIRTPMNAIKGFARIIEENPDNVELVKDAVNKITKSSDILMNLLNNVLELSKIESGKDELNISVVDLEELLNKLYVMFAQEMKESGFDFIISNDIKNDVVMADELKCTRIFLNMISNAKKFTPDGGSVKYGVIQLDEMDETDKTATYRLYVEDTGIGMSKEFQEKAFEQFEMERTSTLSKVSGNGLGLAIIKRLVDNMGGSCHIESEIDNGTKIYVDIKLKVSDIGVGNDSRIAPTSIVKLNGKKVLLVEDNELNREIARYILEDMGIVVDEAFDGLEAVEKLENIEDNNYDFVLMDIQMPVMDGYEATTRIRNMKDSKTANIPIIAMTANAFKEDRDACIAVGMNEHIAKPIDVDKLYIVLNNIFC